MIMIPEGDMTFMRKLFFFWSKNTRSRYTTKANSAVADLIYAKVAAITNVTTMVLIFSLFLGL